MFPFSHIRLPNADFDGDDGLISIKSTSESEEIDVFTFVGAPCHKLFNRVHLILIDHQFYEGGHGQKMIKIITSIDSRLELTIKDWEDSTCKLEVDKLADSLLLVEQEINKNPGQVFVICCGCSFSSSKLDISIKALTRHSNVIFLAPFLSDYNGCISHDSENKYVHSYLSLGPQSHITAYFATVFCLLWSHNPFASSHKILSTVEKISWGKSNWYWEESCLNDICNEIKFTRVEKWKSMSECWKQSPPAQDSHILQLYPEHIFWSDFLDKDLENLVTGFNQTS